MKSRLLPYALIARPDHWFKNIFMLPGIVLAFFFQPSLMAIGVWPRLLAGLVATCLIASSNYVLNEILDAEKDRFHPEKCQRPIPSGLVRIRIAYAEWLILAAAGLTIAFLINVPFGLAAMLLWIAGALYNVPPVRLKDHAYADVISESVNNPLRLVLGWYATGCTVLPPLSAALAYWMFGAFLMAMKRYAEFRAIGNPAQAARYRQSFGHYNEERLIESIVFYGSLFGMLSGFFVARYHVEVILATPIVAYAMAYYMHLGFKPDSPVQRPESLFRCLKLVILVAAAFLACAILLAIDIPGFKTLITASPVEP